MPNSVFVIGDRSSLDAAIDGTAAVLRRGGLAIFPTDTVYVAASVARSGQALSGGIERLFQLKRRGRGPSFPWLVASAADLEVYGRDLTDEALMLATCLWPSGLTLVVRASSAVPRALAREDGTVALRCADSPIASGLLHACAAPLICTGANPHGVATPVTYDEDHLGGEGHGRHGGRGPERGLQRAFDHRRLHDQAGAPAPRGVRAARGGQRGARVRDAVRLIPAARASCGTRDWEVRWRRSWTACSGA